MRYFGFLISALLIFSVNLKADEGMWLPMLLKKYNEKDMQAMGMRISAEDIYSVNQTSLKDGIVIFGGGCTGVVVSPEGLLLTNHHCGYGRIQAHSSIEHDYLTDGFWAMNKNEELKNPGLKVTFLVKMEDVSDQILEGVKDDMTEKIRDSIIASHIDTLISSIEDTSHYDARVRPFYYGNQYILFINEIYEDVRLVGAPPSNIGKFGGDTDNWMWPRHTGDFSVFRIYADSNNNPTKFSKNNVPYKPKYYFPVSTKGVEKDDFTMVFGYPGSTRQYIPSWAVEHVTELQNPIRIELRGKRLDVINKYVEKDPKVRIQYASKSAGIANGWKKWIGESKGIYRMKTIEEKQNYQQGFQKWADSDAERGKKYGNLLSEFEDAYGKVGPLSLSYTYAVEAGLGIEIVRYANSYRRLLEASKKKSSQEDIDKLVENLKSGSARFFKNYHMPIDEEVFVLLLSEYYNDMDPKDQPEIFNMIRSKYKGDIAKYAEYVFSKTFMTSEEKVDEFLDSYKTGKYKKIEKDPAFILAQSIYGIFYQISPQLSKLNNQIDSLQRIYMKAQMEFQPDLRYYPDANFTLRVAYGNVKDYFPKDGVYYDYYTTLDGIMEKEDPEIYDYVVEDKLKELYNEKDYGQYADDDGSMHVCFIANNHTSGGNSGSPVINADGELIGLNFDRCWEGTMSDIVFDPDFCRNITLDIRYCLFIMDKFAGAGHLVEEMTLSEN
ncbi:S46 family peptidase [Bacteroidota bacterium]